MVPAAAFWSQSQHVLAVSSAIPLPAHSCVWLLPGAASDAAVRRSCHSTDYLPALQALLHTHVPKHKTTLLDGSRENSKCPKNMFHHPQLFFSQVLVNHQFSSTSPSSLSSPFSSSCFHFLARDSDQ